MTKIKYILYAYFLLFQQILYIFCRSFVWVLLISFRLLLWGADEMLAFWLEDTKHKPHKTIKTIIFLCSIERKEKKRAVEKLEILGYGKEKVFVRIMT